MTKPTRYPLQRPRAQKAVLAAITEGLTDREIAERLAASGIKVSFQAINKWRKSNLEVVESVVTAVERDIEEYAVSHKVNRVARLDAMAAELGAALAEHGYVYSEETRHSRRLHANPAVSELRATLAAAALERDQLPRAGITVNNAVQVIVKQVTTESGQGNPEL